MSTTQTPLECALALVDATGVHSSLQDFPAIRAAQYAMKPHRTGFETVTDAALRIIAQENKRLAKSEAETLAMNVRLQTQLTAALEQIAVEHRERIKAI